MISTPELVLDARADLGEGPAWEARSGCLYWVDIHAGHLHIFNPEYGLDRFINLGEYLGCAAPRRSGGLVLGRRSGFAILEEPLQSHAQPGEAEVLTIVNPEPHLPGNRFNDGKCDPAGRFLAGSMDDTEIEASGSLYSLSPDGAVKRLLTGTRISNGLAWSPDFRSFYFIDTPTRTVMAYDYDLGSGAIAHPRTVILVPPDLGAPDGMTADEVGMLWVAMWGGAKLTRWNPATGQLMAEIPFPALNVSSCTFGGPHLTDLYVTTARKGMSTEELAKYPLSGGLFRLRTNIQGMPTFQFGG
ncbi:MAG: SMP-30/gluconolactonase/LRE family protein [Anaerolineales bacterium]